ncbi:MAG: hypothetical protein LBG80_18090 [Bacteroidales bacterium]|jgi:hypothetical protein|nr:hypothetical protein [Bacteroidales bacterium]
MEKPTTTQGNPPDKGDIYETVFAFIDNVLFQFKPRSNETGENKITQELEIFLNEKTRVDDTFFAFQNQHEEGNSTTDIGIYLRSNCNFFCWIEAKRLPTPKEKDRDEREYVFVSPEKENGKKIFKGNGGIQRFKEGKHARQLSYSIMFGYIQECDTDYWLNKINGWIKDLTMTNSVFWNESDYLQKQESYKCKSYVSTHSRNGGLIPITLYHFWINLSTDG